MNFPFLNDPKTGKPDEMVTLSVITTLAAVARFLLDGFSFKLGLHTIKFGHVDATVYLALLAPILGAHGYIKGQVDKDANKK